MRKKLVFLALVLILLMQMFLRFPSILSPLDRDEGLYGYMGQRILAGEVPYRDVFDHKPPVIYYIYAAVIKTFGSSIFSIRVFTMFYGALTTIALFAAGYLILGASGGLLAAFIYAVFSGGPMIQGAFSNTEPFMLLPVLLALIFFLKAQKENDRRWYFLAGIMSGLAFMIKQVAVFNFLALLIFALSVQAVWLLLGFMVFPAIFALYFLLAGAFPDYFYCAFLVNRAYLNSSPAPYIFIDPRFGLFMIRETMRENSVIWILSFVSMLIMIFKDRKREMRLLGWWAFASFLGVAAGKLFFGHYFIQLIPALCLLSAYALLRIHEEKSLLTKIAAGILIIMALLPNLQYLYPFYFKYDPYRIVELQHGVRSFGIARYAALLLENKLAKNDDVFVWAAEPEVYFYLNKKAVGRYPYYFLWMKKLGIGEAIVNDVIRKKPGCILWADYAPRDQKLEKWLINNYTFNENMMGWKLFERKKQWQK